jgi:2-polyprenyl-6-hydroxyphenyl methylase/3-demethylubiquinone-9 3-methyltransferase
MKSKNFKSTTNETSRLFDKLSNEWWDEDGSFKALHSFNLIRIQYLKKNNLKKSLNGLNILDVGCGGGILCEPLSRLGANVTGIDSNKKAIEVAKEHAKMKNLKISYINAELSELKRCSFDIVTCMEVLEHVDDVGQIISFSNDLLKKNGIFFGSTINKTLSSYLFAIFFAENVLQIVPRGTHEWKKFLKPNYIKKKLLENGFNDFQVQGVNYDPFKNSWSFSERASINYMFFAYKS